MSQAKYESCVSNSAAREALNARAEYWTQHYFIDSTPTFVVNGKVMPAGYHSLADLDAAIGPALAAGRSHR